MEEQTLHQASESLFSLLPKAFVALSSGNIVVGALALLEFIPAISSLISLVFLIWVGVLTIRERNKSIQIKDMILDEKEQQRLVEESQG